MKRILVALMAGAAVFTIAFASAAALGVNGNVIQAGIDSDVSCDLDGVNANWGLETDTNSVSYVTIVDIADACTGADLFASVNGNHAVKGAVIAGGQSKVTFPAAYSAEEIQTLKVWIEG
jgi:hypothetical protein